LVLICKKDLEMLFFCFSFYVFLYVTFKYCFLNQWLLFEYTQI
jgi:hypothetical protein